MNDKEISDAYLLAHNNFKKIVKEASKLSPEAKNIYYHTLTTCLASYCTEIAASLRKDIADLKNE